MKRLRDHMITVQKCSGIDGIGVDIEEVRRFKGLDLRKDKIFLDKIFTGLEKRYCFSRSMPEQHLAARFAAKEAVIKAVRSCQRDLAYSNVEINNDASGRPMARIKFSEKSKKDIKKERERYDIELSISHCRDYAVAFAVVFKDKKSE